MAGVGVERRDTHGGGKYHQLVSGFRPHGPRLWRGGVEELDPHEIVCHNDFAPYNLVHKDGHLIGIIDWDLAGPERPTWDLAWAAWNFCLIHHPDHSRSLGPSVDVGRRPALLCDSYGLEARSGFVQLIHDRIAAAVGFIEGRAAEGERSFQKLIVGGNVLVMREAMVEIEAHIDDWQDAIA